MQVNPTGRDKETGGVELAPGRSLLASDRSDPASCDCNVPAKCGPAGPIDDGASANDDVVHANLPSLATLVTRLQSRPASQSYPIRPSNRKGNMRCCSGPETALRVGKILWAVSLKMRHVSAYLTAPPVMPEMKRSRNRL